MRSARLDRARRTSLRKPDERGGGSIASNGSAVRIESGEKCESGALHGGLSTSEPSTAIASSWRTGCTTLIVIRGDDALRGRSDGRGVGVTGDAKCGTELERRID